MFSRWIQVIVLIQQVAFWTLNLISDVSFIPLNLKSSTTFITKPARPLLIKTEILNRVELQLKPPGDLSPG